MEQKPKSADPVRPPRPDPVEPPPAGVRQPSHIAPKGATLGSAEGRPSKNSLARLIAAAAEVEHELSHKEIEHQELEQELELARGTSKRYLARLAALEVELQSLKRERDQALQDEHLATQALQDEQDAFLALLLDEHEQETASLRRERDDALGRLALAEHQAKRVDSVEAVLQTPPGRELQKRLDWLRSECDEARREADAAQSGRAETQRMLADAQQEAADARRERDRAQEQRDLAVAEIERLRNLIGGTNLRQRPTDPALQLEPHQGAAAPPNAEAGVSAVGATTQAGAAATQAAATQPAAAQTAATQPGAVRRSSVSAGHPSLRAPSEPPPELLAAITGTRPPPGPTLGGTRTASRDARTGPREARTAPQVPSPAERPTQTDLHAVRPPSPVPRPDVDTGWEDPSATSGAEPDRFHEEPKPHAAPYFTSQRANGEVEHSGGAEAPPRLAPTPPTRPAFEALALSRGEAPTVPPPALELEEVFDDELGRFDELEDVDIPVARHLGAPSRPPGALDALDMTRQLALEPTAAREARRTAPTQPGQARVSPPVERIMRSKASLDRSPGGYSMPPDASGTVEVVLPTSPTKRG